MKNHHKSHILALAVFGIVLFLTSVIDKGVLILHWAANDFSNLYGFSVWTPLIGLVGASAYLLVMVFTRARENWSLWALGAAWIIFEIVLLYGIWTTIGFEAWLTEILPPW